MRPEHFHVGRPLGTGHSRPNDVARIRRALRETGHASPAREPSGTYDASAIAAIERFQNDFGLEADGVVLPGGPTERVLDLALAAKRESGETGYARIREAFAAFANAGLKFAPTEPDDQRPGVFTDERGKAVSPGNLRALLDRARSPGPQPSADETQIAALPLALPAILAGSEGLSSALAALLGLGAGAAGAIAVGKAVKRGDGEVDPNAQRERNAAIREMSPPLPPTPPYPAEPPKLPDQTGAPSEPPKLSNRTEFPAEPPELPQVLIFPDHSDLLPPITILHSHRGNDDTKAQVLKVQLEYQRKYQDLEHIAGGYKLSPDDLKSNELDLGKLEEVKERAMPGPGRAFENSRGRPGDGRPGSRLPDLLFKNKITGKLLAVNTVDVDENGQIAQHELDAAENLRRQRIEVHLIKKTHQMKTR